MKDPIVFRTSKREYTKQEMAAAYEAALLLTEETIPMLSGDVHPSERFYRSVDHMSRRYMRRQRLYLAGRTAVAVLIAGLLFFAATLTISAQARQAVINWWKEIWENRIVYLWTRGDMTEPGSVYYELDYIPEGYELVESDKEDGFGYYIYESEEGSFVFEYEAAASFDALEYVPLGDYTHWQQPVNSLQANVYADTHDEEMYTMVLVDEPHGYVLYLDARMDLQTFNAIADGIVVNDRVQ